MNIKWLNGRVVGAIVISLTLVWISSRGNNQQVAEQSETPQVSETNTENSDVKNNDKAPQVQIGSTPQAGPVEVEKQTDSYSATVRKGDNQTVIVRQIVNDYLSDNSLSLSPEQRLYTETVLVDSLPRNDLIYPGAVLKVASEKIQTAVSDSSNLTEYQLSLWSKYLK